MPTESRRRSKAQAASGDPAWSTGFNPWTATLDEARALHLTRQQWPKRPAAPLYQWNGAQQVLGLRDAVEGGDGFAVLAAVAFCAHHELVMPEWLARAYIGRYQLVQQLGAASWDRAFGRPYPKKFPLAHRRRQRWQRIAVHGAVADFVRRYGGRRPLEDLWAEFARKADEGSELDPELSEDVRSIGVRSKSTAQELFAEAVKLLGWDPRDRRDSLTEVLR